MVFFKCISITQHISSCTRFRDISQLHNIFHHAISCHYISHQHNIFHDAAFLWHFLTTQYVSLCTRFRDISQHRTVVHDSRDFVTLLDNTTCFIIAAQPWHIFVIHFRDTFFVTYDMPLYFLLDSRGIGEFSLKLRCMCLFKNRSRPFRLICIACQYGGVGFLFFCLQAFRQFGRILTTSLVDDDFF